MNMCKAFAEAGVEVTLFVPRRRVSATVDPFAYYGMEKNFVLRKVPCIDLSLYSPNPFFYWLRLISFYICARVELSFQSFDYIYSRDIYAPFFFRDATIERHSFPKNISSFARRMLRKASGIVVLTSFIKERMTAVGVPEKKIMVAPDAVDVGIFDTSALKPNIPSIKESDFIFGYIGTLKTMGMEKGVS
jgi:hypothetical protein